MVRSDFEFNNSQLRIMPLDVNKEFPRMKWTQQHKDKSSWIIVEIPGVTFDSSVGSGANGVVLKAIEGVSQNLCCENMAPA